MASNDIRPAKEVLKKLPLSDATGMNAQPQMGMMQGNGPQPQQTTNVTAVWSRSLMTTIL